jgi:hypothetical protein
MSDNPETSATPPPQSSPSSLPYQLEADDKVTPIMVYTITGMSHGELISKELVRVSTWLRSVAGITYITLYRAQSMTIAGGNTPQVASYSELHIPINQVVAYHILPPANEPLDYDPSEPHRKMESLIISFGPFRALGKLRLGETTNLATHLKTSRETYMSIYDVEVSNPSIPNMAAIKTPLMLVQPNLATFAVKT